MVCCVVWSYEHIILYLFDYLFTLKMGCCGEMEPMELLDEMGNQDPSSFGGIKRDRQSTDKPALIGMGVFFVILFCIIGFCMVNGDIDRVLKGYDDCGNVCGKNNKKIDFDPPIPCFGKDMEEKKYLLTTIETHGKVSLFEQHSTYQFNYTKKECVKDCKSNNAVNAFLNRCFPINSNIPEDISLSGDFFKELSEDIQISWGRIILLILLAMSFSLIMMVLFRYATAFVVWFVLISLILISVGFTVFLWVLYKKASTEFNQSYNFENREKKQTLLYFALLATILSAVIILIIAVMFKKIKLVIQLFKEATKAISAMPVILLQPILTFIALFITIICGIYFESWITTNGNLQKITEEQARTYHENPDSYDYMPTAIVIIASVFNFVGVLWMIQFIIGCQHYIIAGCVATWFFSRNKNDLGSPLIFNTRNLLKYHLGTIAFGSLIITIVQVIKALVQGIRNQMKNSKSFLACLLDFCARYVLEWIEEMLKFFSRNAYIETAVYGISFCTGGKRALRLLVNNIFKVIAINSVGDFVLIFTKIYIVVATVFVSFEVFRNNDKLHHVWFPVFVVAIVTYFIAHCFITVFEMTIDTIFLCFCEDCEHNDGLSKPYFMSRNLMEFVENSNKVLNKKNWNETDQNAWDNGPKRLLQQRA